jgi:hypothetical protein
LILISAVAAALLAVGLAFAPRAVLRGWLLGFLVISEPLLGAIALLCIGRLTGGRWIAAAEPILRSAALAAPLLCLAFLPLLLGARLLYPWAVAPQAAGGGVAAHYLNVDFFAVRGGVCLVGLSVVGALLARRSGGLLLAALGLTLFAVCVDFTAVDWILSLSPRFSSSAFGAQIAIQHLLAALALVLLAAPPECEGARVDLAGLMLATALGELYLTWMSGIVNWYGDQPDRAAWYLARLDGAWRALAMISLLFGAIAPIASLMFEAVRRSPTALRFVAASILIGVALRDLWLIAPAAGPLATLAAVLAIIAIGPPAAAFSTWANARLGSGERTHAG